MDADLERYESELAAVSAALTRLDDGTYGNCSACGQPIPDEELRASPAAQRHVNCG